MGKRTHLQYIIFMWRLLLIMSTKLAQGIALVNSDYQSRIPKMEYYKFCKQGWIWSAQSSIQQTHVDALYNAKQLSQESNTLGGLSFSPVKCSWNVK